jgi:hypothetical protein
VGWGGVGWGGVGPGGSCGALNQQSQTTRSGHVRTAWEFLNRWWGGRVGGSLVGAGCGWGLAAVWAVACGARGGALARLALTPLNPMPPPLIPAPPQRHGYINFGVAPAITDRGVPERPGSVIVVGAGLAGEGEWGRRGAGPGWWLGCVGGWERPESVVVVGAGLAGASGSGAGQPLLRAGQGRAGQGRAGQGRAGQGRAGQGRAGQGRAGQGSLCSGSGGAAPQATGASLWPAAAALAARAPQSPAPMLSPRHPIPMQACPPRASCATGGTVWPWWRATAGWAGACTATGWRWGAARRGWGCWGHRGGGRGRG